MSDKAKKDEEIIQEAQERFKRCEDFEATFRNLFVADIKFCNADSDNMYQWPNELRQSRARDSRPSLTINKTRQHALMVQNEIKENLPAVKISPTGGNASYDSAQVYAGVVRHIEYNSNAAGAYANAMTYQVQGGIGYWRITTGYAHEDSFDQEIFIKRVKDPLSVYIDCDCVESDGSDAKYNFVFDDMEVSEFRRKYPKATETIASVTFGKSAWVNKDCVRVAEYMRCVYEDDWLVALPIRDEQGQAVEGEYDTLRMSEIPQQLRKAVREDESIKRRKIETEKWEWYLIAGNEIIDRKIWPGKYNPIVRVVGEEMLIEGELERKGHVRNLKDPQRMYNYWTSSAVEQVALQGKQPYMASVQAIKGFESYYANANRLNYSYIPFNGIDDQGNPIAPPQREQPPQMAGAYISGMQIAAEEMKMVSGQADPTMGMQANEIAGVAIQRRIKQGDKATFHFIDNLSSSIRYTGKILIDLIPKIYDTPRVIRIRAEDGSDEEIRIDPNQKEALTTQSEGDQEAQRIFNPSVGKYEVVAQAGPAYATRREEAAEAMTAVFSTNPQLMATAGDLFFRMQDFPMAEELAERLSNTIPSSVKGEGPTPEEQQLQQQLQDGQQQMQDLQAQLASSMQALADEQKKSDDKAKANEINAYKAVTDRLDSMLTRMEKLGPLPVLDMVSGQTAGIAMNEPQPMTEQQQPQATNQELPQ
jgi:hypothetical protein